MIKTHEGTAAAVPLLYHGRKILSCVEKSQLCGYCFVSGSEYNDNRPVITALEDEMELEIGTKIKKLRRERSLTQEEMASHLGVSFQSVSKWERGVSQS